MWKGDMGSGEWGMGNGEFIYVGKRSVELLQRIKNLSSELERERELE